MEVRELEQHIAALVSIEESASPFVSCYLDVERGVYRTVLDERVHLLRKTFPSVEKRRDFDSAILLIEAYLDRAINRETKGLALFARGGIQSFFLPLQFQVSVPNWIVANSLPNVYHLAEIKDTYHRYMVMLAAENSIRILAVNLGTVTQEVWDRRAEARRRDGRGWTREHYRSHLRERKKQFLHESIQVLERLMLAGGYKHLILAGNPRVTSGVRQAFSKQLTARLVDIVHASANDALTDVVRATLTSFVEQEEQESQAMVDRLLESVSTDGLAVVGARASINALRARQADVLILARDYSPDPGWVCPACQASEVDTAMPDRCPKCQRPGLTALDVKEELVRVAERNSCEVEVVNQSDALMRLGGVGCLLRYLAPGQYLPRAA
jgi:protein required for attachment to host cells